jgi:hypothetical protein
VLSVFFRVGGSCVRVARIKMSAYFWSISSMAWWVHRPFHIFPAIFESSYRSVAAFCIRSFSGSVLCLRLRKSRGQFPVWVSTAGLLRPGKSMLSHREQCTASALLRLLPYWPRAVIQMTDHLWTSSASWRSLGKPWEHGYIASTELVYCDEFCQYPVDSDTVDNDTFRHCVVRSQCRAFDLTSRFIGL